MHTFICVYVSVCACGYVCVCGRMRVYICIYILRNDAYICVYI